MNTTIKTFSGKTLDYRNPKPECICLQDIAVGLSHECRYAGQISQFYSVAEHSIIVADAVPAHMKLAALLHDASEAYLKDIPTPLKDLLPEYRQIEHNFMFVIAKKFGFKYPFEQEIKEADKLTLLLEMNYLHNQKKCHSKLKLMNSREAFVAFINAYYKITGKRTM